MRRAAIATAVVLARSRPAVAVNQIVAPLLAGGSSLPAALVMQAVEAIASASLAVLTASTPQLRAMVAGAS